MKKKIEESRRDGDVRISRVGDGRYAFYLTRTPTIRTPNNYQEPIETEREIHLDLRSTSSTQIAEQGRKEIKIGIDLEKLKEQSNKIDTIYFIRL